jgi:hypothetical protein
MSPARTGAAVQQAFTRRTRFVERRVGFYLVEFNPFPEAFGIR